MTTIAGRIVTRDMRRQMARESAKLPVTLQPVPQEAWPYGYNRLTLSVYRSREFLVQVFAEPGGIIRLSVNRTVVDTKTNRWGEDIGWDDLQRIKRECGYGNSDAVEVYPMDCDVVNVASMRHLFVMPEELTFKWKKR